MFVIFIQLQKLQKLVQIYVIDAWPEEMKSDALQIHRDHRKFR